MASSAAAAAADQAGPSNPAPAAAANPAAPPPQSLRARLDDPVATAAQMAGVDPAVARALLREEYGKVDALVPKILDAVRERGGAECWHKHSTFLSHLTGTWAIAALWGLPREIQLCSLLHSAFSNSFVNLALFSPDEDGRKSVRELAGEDVERWTWLFCRVPRNELIYDRLVDPICYGGGGAGGAGGSSAAAAAKQQQQQQQQREKDAAALDYARQPPAAKRARAVPPLDEPNTSTPDYASQFPDSVTVADIRDGSPIELDPYEIGVLVALTILDFSEQWHSWQDGMFATLEDAGGRLRFQGAKRAHMLWPGPGKPGLYLHTLSEMGRLVVAANAKLEAMGDERRVPLPKPWASCAYAVSRRAQMKGRDLYWQAVQEMYEAGAAEFEEAAAWAELEHRSSTVELRACEEDEPCDGPRNNRQFQTAEEDKAAMRARIKDARRKVGDASTPKSFAEMQASKREEQAEGTLRECASLVPCVGEPKILISQLLIQRAQRLSFEAADAGLEIPTLGPALSGLDAVAAKHKEIEALWREAGKLALEGLSLLLAWGTPWDKRFSWGAWCAWARVCCEAARTREWPGNDEPLRVINLGLVR